MSTAVQVQYRRGTSSQISSFTGAAGEMVVDTTNNRVVIQDGATAGGFPAAKLSEVLSNARTTVNDAAYAALTSDRTVAYTAVTAARIVSLPTAALFPTGTRLLVVDESGSCSGTKTITLSANGSDQIDGASTAVINAAYGYCAIESNGSGKWTIIDQPGAAGGVTSLNTLSGGLSIAARDGTVVAASGSTVTIGAPGGMVNKFRNGTMDVWQRGTSSITVTTAGAYTADGWIVTPTGASCTAVRASNNRTGANTLYGLQLTGASSVTDIQATQRIESYIAAALAGKTVTVQAQVYNNTGSSITPTLTTKYAGSTDSWGSPTTDLSATNLQACANGGWTQVAYTLSVSASAAAGYEVIFDFGNNFSTTGKDVVIAELDVRVTPGVSTGLNANPPPPELRPIWTELAGCQRYFRVSYDIGVTPGTTSQSPGEQISQLTVSVSNAGYYLNAFPFTVTMRADPTLVPYSQSAGTSGKVDIQGSPVTASVIAGEGGIYAVQNNSGSSWSAGNQLNFHYTASAEL